MPKAVGSNVFSSYGLHDFVELIVELSIYDLRAIRIEENESIFAAGFLVNFPKKLYSLLTHFGFTDDLVFCIRYETPNLLPQIPVIVVVHFLAYHDLFGLPIHAVPR